MREQREREAKRELKLAGQSAKQRASGELSDRALADLALPATRGPASQHTDYLDDATLLHAERALLGATVPGQMNEDWWSSVAEVLEESRPPKDLHLPQAPAPSISQMAVPPRSAPEPWSAGQPRSNPSATLLGRPSSASQKSTSAVCQLKR